MSGGGGLKIETSLNGGEFLLLCSGVMNEDTDFGPTLGELTDKASSAKTITFDLGKVTRMNSVGIREWLLFLERIPASYRLRFRNVSQLFVEQANMIPHMLGKSGSQIESFFGPYVCPKCQEPVLKLLNPSQIQGKAPSHNCERCGTQLEFDWIEAEYFHFLKRTG